MDIKDINVLDNQARVRRWPKKKAEKLCVLEYLAAHMQADRDYTEKEVNAVICEWHTFGDHALLRRELFDHFLLDRTPDGKTYRKALVDQVQVPSG